MNIDIRYGVGGAPLWHVSADQGQSWRLKISLKDDASMAFSDIDGSGEGQNVIPYAPGTYWFFLYTSAMIPVTKISYTVAAPTPTPLPTPPVFNPKPGEPVPLAPKEEILGTIGTSCDLVNNYSFARSVYYGRNRYTGQTTEQSMDYETARGKAERNSACQQPAPPTAKDWQDGIQKQVTAGFDALSKYVSDGLKSVTESWQNGILDLEGRLKAWTSDSIKTAIAPLLDLEGRLKVWISDMILELLLKKLLEGRKLVIR